jgi:hypothetical protein
MIPDNVLRVKARVKTAVPNCGLKCFKLSNTLLHARVNEPVALFDNLKSIQSSRHDGRDYHALQTSGEAFAVDFRRLFEVDEWVLVGIVRVYARGHIVLHERTLGEVNVPAADRLSFGFPDCIIDYDIRSLQQFLGDTNRLLDVLRDRHTPGNELESMDLSFQGVYLVWSE